LIITSSGIVEGILLMKRESFVFEAADVAGIVGVTTGVGEGLTRGRAVAGVGRTITGLGGSRIIGFKKAA
jgi:hypothetical protein